MIYVKKELYILLQEIITIYPVNCINLIPQIKIE